MGSSICSSLMDRLRAVEGRRPQEWEGWVDSSDSSAELARRCHFYTKYVPKDPGGNAAWRRKVAKLGGESREAAQWFWQASRRDPLFWINTFGMTLNPRDRGNVPFITWPFQDRIVLALWSSLGKYDMVMRKSRQVGMSWLCLSLVAWNWAFYGDRSFIVASRKMEYVDNTGDPKELFSKMDHLLAHQPGWLIARDEFQRRKASLYHHRTHSHISGESRTESIGRGSATTAILLDEFQAFTPSEQAEIDAATASATNCRWFNGTAGGMTSAFADLAHREGISKVTAHWSQVEERVRGAYTSAGRKLVILDEKYRFPKNYHFELDGKLRSPWFDYQLRRSSNPDLEEREQNINFYAGSSVFFRPDVIRDHIARNARSPFSRGELEHESQSGEVVHWAPGDGRVKLWLHLDARHRPPGDRQYVIGADVATGTVHGSYSTLSVVDTVDREKVASFKDRGLGPYKFASLAVAMARWFNNALLIWEANGPGRDFGARVLELNYNHIHYRRQDDRIDAKTTTFPGWWSNDSNKVSLLRAYEEALASDAFVNHESEAVEECKSFNNVAGGKVEHIGALSALDAGGLGVNHGDMVIADALANNRLPTDRPQHIEPDQIQAFSRRWRDAKASRSDRPARKWPSLPWRKTA